MWRLTSEMEKIFIIKAGKSISIISVEEDGLIRTFQLAKNIFFKYIWTKSWYFCQILTTYGGKLRQRKGPGFHQKAAIYGILIILII